MSLRPFAQHMGLAARRIAIGALAGLAAYIHWSLGGTIFVLNAAGYATLGTAAVLLPRYGTLARLALAAFAVTTITLWIFVGARFDLAYLTKAIEVALVVVLLLDLRADLSRRRRHPGLTPAAAVARRSTRPGESF